MPFNYEFITNPSPEEVRQIIDLYRMADWWGADDDAQPDLVRRIVSGSHCFLIAQKRHTLVGMGRAISDRINDAYLQDITVNPAYRHRNIGTKIVEKLVERLRQDGLRWIGLIAGNQSYPFYRRLGFAEMPLSTPMLWQKEI
jgi:spermidine synthase